MDTLKQPTRYPSVASYPNGIIAFAVGYILLDTPATPTLSPDPVVTVISIISILLNLPFTEKINYRKQLDATQNAT